MSKPPKVGFFRSFTRTGVLENLIFVRDAAQSLSAICYTTAERFKPGGSLTRHLAEEQEQRALILFGMADAARDYIRLIHDGGPHLPARFFTPGLLRSVREYALIIQREQMEIGAAREAASTHWSQTSES